MFGGSSTTFTSGFVNLLVVKESVIKTFDWPTLYCLFHIKNQVYWCWWLWHFPFNIYFTYQCCLKCILWTKYYCKSDWTKYQYIINDLIELTFNYFFRT
jgi:hypothetical protein